MHAKKSATEIRSAVNYLPPINSRILLLLNRLRMPLLLKIKNRYAKLHKKWSDSRVRMMKEMGLSGGDGDVAAICPVCNLDRRNVNLEKREGTKELKGGTGNISKKIEKPVNQVRSGVAVVKAGMTWKRKSAKSGGSEKSP